MTLPRRTGLAVLAWTVACSAFGGAVGLVTGSLDLGGGLNHRLPFDSPVLGGIALALWVGLPNAVLAVRAWRAERRTDVTAIAVGFLLITWIGVELLFIRQFSFLQPAFAGLGGLLVVIGWFSLLGSASASADRSHERVAP